MCGISVSGAEADDGEIAADQRAKFDRKPGGERLQRDVHHPSVQQRSLGETDGHHGIRRLGGRPPRPSPDDGDVGDGSGAGEGNGFPLDAATRRAGLSGRHGQQPAAATTNALEPPGPGFLEEGLERDQPRWCERGRVAASPMIPEGLPNSKGYARVET